MKKFYLLYLLVLASVWVQAQTCTGLSILATGDESRCAFTGSITVTANGGSGSYSYRVSGPVNTPFTSSPTITGLQAGWYTVTVRDVNADCIATLDSVQVSGDYMDPRFQLTKINATCAGNDGRISVINQQFGRGPFAYTIIAPSPMRVGNTNATGVFTGLIPGEYFVRLQDSCGGLQVRRITIEEYYWWIDGTAVTKVGCDSADATVSLRNNRSGNNTTDTLFNNYRYAVVVGTDTTWFTSRSFRFRLGKARQVRLIAQDNCGRTEATDWNLPANQAPGIGGVATSNFNCNGFRATVTGGNNLTAPQYCLFDASNNQLSCNTTGVFDNLAYGAYCVRVRDLCYDTTITQCFTAARPQPNVSNTVAISARTCNSFTASITGGVNLTNPNYCLYNSSNTLIQCNSSGVFNNLPYGQYCITMKDGCTDTLITRCFTATPPPPAIGNTVLTNLSCSTFTVSVDGQANLTNPNFCLYDSTNTLITCNSTGTFTNLPYGRYCITMQDGCIDTTITRCFTPVKPQPQIDNLIGYGNYTCSTFTASVNGERNLTNPQYCLYDNLGNLISCNSTGDFDGLPYGQYCIRVTDVCYDTTIVRCFTAGRPLPVLNPAVLSNANCTTVTATVSGSYLFNPQYCLYDSTGAQVACNTTGVFTGLAHGRYCIKAFTSCGDSTALQCFTSVPPRPTVSGTVALSNFICSGFTATITGQQNFTNPFYYLYNSANVKIDSNSTGVFSNIPYGSYCITAKDGCLDTTVTRCFSRARAVPGIAGTIQQTGSTCNTVSLRLTGTNLTAPQFCLIDSNGVQVACNSTGVFNNVPYNKYCIRVRDGCVDTTMQVCQTFLKPKGLALTSAKSCTIGSTVVGINVTSSFGPYNVRVFRPDGTQVYNQTHSNGAQFTLPGLPAGQQYKVVSTDLCGQKDSAYITPDVSVLQKTISNTGRCPSAVWLNGAGQLTVTCSSNLSAVFPSIIKKNNAPVNITYSTQAGTTFTFADLEPATYIMEYNVQSCNTKVYDTVTIYPYTYPTQGQSALYMCDNSSFTLNADVQGGIGPYTFQIIGSNPSSPDITTLPQTSPRFTINTGSTYSLVRLRTVDVCGNATLSDVSVLPLENIAITADRTCFYQNITLSVPNIRNATYRWFRKTSPFDSTAVGNTNTYNLPFFVPEEVGEYTVKIDVDNGCVQRYASFVLDGDCGYVFLPGGIKFSGKKQSGAHHLQWTTADDRNVATYVVERRTGSSGAFTPIATVAAKNTAAATQYSYVDADVTGGSYAYRLKLTGRNNGIQFTNIVVLGNGDGGSATVYPNPAKQVIWVQLRESAQTGNYTLSLLNLQGQVIDQKMLNTAGRNVMEYRRPAGVQKGMYLLRLTNSSGTTTETFKIMFE